MRLLAAILLWGILLFNLVGYRFLTGYLQGKAERRLEARLDHRQYDRSQLITVKVPLTDLSYYNSSTTFQRVDGQIEINGIPCQYVERRIFGDSLELLCIPNPTVLKLRAGGDHSIKLVTDVQWGDPYILVPPIALAVLPVGVISHAHYFSVRIPATTAATDERPPAMG